MAYGLYEVVRNRIYQVRGYDLSTSASSRAILGGSFLTPDCQGNGAGAALEFVNDKLGARPVVGDGPRSNATTPRDSAGYRVRVSET